MYLRNVVVVLYSVCLVVMFAIVGTAILLCFVDNDQSEFGRTKPQTLAVDLLYILSFTRDRVILMKENRENLYAT